MAFDDKRRLRELLDYRILDTPEEELFDNLTRLVAKIFRTPIALVSLVDEKRQWFKARVGLGVRELPREHAFCDHAVRGDRTLLVPDATTDARFRDNPLVTGEPGIRFYCGVPLRTPKGECLGTLCLIDRAPRTMNEAELGALEDFARQVEMELELRRRLAILGEVLSDQEDRMKSKQALASMLVHDLRSPLTSVMMLAAAIRPADDESKADIADILAEASRIRRMLADVLDICLHEAGSLSPRRRRFSMEMLVRAVGRRMGRLADRRGQRVGIEVPAEPVELDADPELIERVLENLVNNAIDHGPSAAAISIVVTKRAAGRVRLEVRDEGDPIPTEAAGRLFEASDRLTPSASLSHRGYGLGLAFSKLAVAAHAGTIGVTPGARGNTFYFELPA